MTRNSDFVKIAIVLAGLTLVPQHIWAQTAPDVGIRLRICGPGNQITFGRYLGASGDSLLYAPLEGGTRTVPLDAIKSLQRSLGVKSASAPGLGALFGTIAGAAGFAAYYESSGDDAVLGYTALGAAVGAGTGLIVGTALRRERWQTMELPRTGTLPSEPLRTERHTQAKLDEIGRSNLARFRTFEGRELIGVYAGRDSAFAHLIAANTEAIPITTIREIQEQRSVTGRYALNGLLIGSLAGSIALGIGAAANGGCDDFDACAPAELFSIAMGLGAVAGGATGLLVGTVIGTSRTRWRTIR